MARLNEHYKKLSAGYLFPEIGRRTRLFQESHPEAQILRLGIGNTTEPLTAAVVQGLHDGVSRLASRDTYTGYGDEQGMEELRKKLADFYTERGVTLDVDEIFISDGAKPDSGNIQSIFSSDCIAAFQDPAYPVYVDTNVISGRSGEFDAASGRYRGLVYLPCTEENGFFPDLPESKVDLLYICSPNNPTGATASYQQLSEYVAYARQHGGVVIYDASYSEYISDPSLPKSIYEIEGAEECAIEINSFSKFAGFTGVRLGWSVVPKALVTEDSAAGEANRLWFRRQTTFFNGASNIVQYGGLSVLSPEGLEECRGLIGYYMENAKIIREGLKSLGLTVYGGDNAPYLWLKTPGGMSSWDFFDKLLHETWVIGTPGSGFGPAGEGFFRLSAFGHREDVEEAVSRIQSRLKI